MSAPTSYPPPDYDTGSPVNLQYASNTASQQTTSATFVNMQGMTLTLPVANVYQDSALVTLCVPNSYATGSNYPGTNFAVAANGSVVASGGFTYEQFRGILDGALNASSAPVTEAAKR